MRNLLKRAEAAKIQIGLGLLVVLLFVAHAADWLHLGVIDQLDNLAYDQRLLLTMPKRPDPRILIVDIDEKSLAAEGRWPWSRDKLAVLVRRLFDEYQIGLLGFDIVFAEPDNSSGLEVLDALANNELRGDVGFRQALEKMRPRLNYDRQFAEAIAHYPVVLGYYFNFAAAPAVATRSGALPQPTFVKGTFTGKNIGFRQADGYGGNLPALQASAHGGGHFNPQPDPDGMVRRVPMLINYEGAYYASLSLEMARQILGDKQTVTPGFGEPLFGGRGYPGLEWLTIGRAAVPVDRSVQALVPYRGYRGSFTYLSATDVLNGKVDKQLLKNAVVLVGTTAPGLLDLRATPVGEAYPGVEVHANLIAGILDGTIKQLPAYTLAAEGLLLLLFGVVLAVAAPLLRPLLATGLTLALLAAYLGLNLVVWVAGNLVLPLAGGLILLSVLFMLNMSYGYFIETRGKRQLSSLFGHYLPPELVAEMALQPTAYSLAPTRCEMSILFLRVRGFAALTAGLSPQELADFLNQFLTPMTRVIHEHRGTIDKYLGPAVMAFWGAPLPASDHALNALRAGLAMRSQLATLNQQFAARGWPTLQVGIGINTDTMTVGNLGSEFRRTYTVLGTAADLGMRLEALTQRYGVEILLGEHTRDAMPEYAYREIDLVLVAGHPLPMPIYEPIGRRDELDAKWKDELKLHREALRLYRTSAWDVAEVSFVNLARTSRSPALYKVYIERIRQFRRSPPPIGWEGVHALLSE